MCLCLCVCLSVQAFRLSAIQPASEPSIIHPSIHLIRYCFLHWLIIYLYVYICLSVYQYISLSIYLSVCLLRFSPNQGPSWWKFSFPVHQPLVRTKTRSHMGVSFFAGTTLFVVLKGNHKDTSHSWRSKSSKKSRAGHVSRPAQTATNSRLHGPKDLHAQPGNAQLADRLRGRVVTRAQLRIEGD